MAQEANACPQAIKDAISKIPLTDENDKELKATEIRLVEEERAKIYKERIEDLQDETKVKYVVSVECVPKDEEDDIKIEDKTVLEKIFSVDDKFTQFNEIEIEDMIMYIDMSPSDSVEYTFYENGPWFLSCIGQDSMESYKGSKFKVWKKQIEEPVCEAAFKRLLCIGLITTIFDRFCFAIPENEKQDYIVKDDHGKDVEIPRPVKRLRIWDVKTRKYKEIDPTLGGAPSKDEADKYWEDMLDNFRQTRGIDYINGLLDSFKKE